MSERWIPLSWKVAKRIRDRLTERYDKGMKILPRRISDKEYRIPARASNCMWSIRRRAI